MYNDLEVTTEQLSNSEQPHWSSPMQPDAPRSAEFWMSCSTVLWDYFTSALKYAASFGTEGKNILKSVYMSSKCYKQLEYVNFGAIGSMGCVSINMPVHLDSGAILSGS
jgi:hypothetical protein